MLQFGQNIAQFIILKRLGAGGMGEVYLAEDTKLGRKIALKILRSDYFGDRERKDRFYREAKTAAGVSHPNVMAIHDMGVETDPATGKKLDYIVMEYIDGTPLSAYLQQVGSDIKTIVHLAEQIAAGLAAAHKVSIVHRDIKTDNIIINADGVPKILDFGLAKPIAPYQNGDNDNTDTVSKELTKAGKIVGTVSYMSPEQIQGESVDNRSDIFSFGILLYRMTTGTPPFEGDTQVSTLAKILESSPEPPRTKNDQIPPELERIIDKCLQKNPDDRFQDTRDLVVDLRNLRRQYDSGVSSITSDILKKGADAAAAPKSQRRWISPVLAVIAVAMVAVVIFQIMEGSDHSPGVAAEVENGLAILGFENKTGEDSLDWLQTGLPEILVTDLAQAQTLSIISRDRVIDCLKADEETTNAGFSHPECLAAAKSLGAIHALSGTYYRLGTDYRIDARLEELESGKIVFTEKVVGTDWFALVDSLTEKIANSLKIDAGPATATSVTTYTSSSPQAYRAYWAGMDNFEKALYDESIEEFKEAIALDSTFALPYMRIGMAHIFSGRQQEGAQWFVKAQRYRDRLPRWEATLLDIYSDLWLDHNFDDAFVKMELLVKNHPNDKESRFIYGVLLQTFIQDTAQTFAQLDTALQLDPKYLHALSQYAQIYALEQKYPEAVEYARRARRYQPDSPTPYLLLGGLYTNMDQFDQAFAQFTDMLDRFPDHPSALNGLIRISVFRRDFEAAEEYAERLRKTHSDDPYTMEEYYDHLANLANWRGRFKTAMDYRFKRLDQVMKTGDSIYITQVYMEISGLYKHIGMPDSATYYSHRSYEFAPPLMRLNHPLSLVEIDPANADTARPLFEYALMDVKARLPEQLWPLVHSIQEAFEARVAGDPAAIADAMEHIYENTPGSGISNHIDAGIYAIQAGQFKRGRDILSRYVSGLQRSSSAIRNFNLQYYLGVAEEGLDNHDKAAEHYRELLRFWGDPDTEIKEIIDARRRLARLTS